MEKMFFDDIALKVPEILLPAEGTDLEKWAVIACDQYTSQPEYWDRVGAVAGTSPSTFRLILPEALLESPDVDNRIKEINSTMKTYLETGVFAPPKQGFMLIDRKTPYCDSRKGLLVCLDLEKYDFSKDAGMPIRATEDTIVDRLPPRMNIRRNALLELPHIMVLINDPDRSVIEPLFNKPRPAAYSTPLMLNGGYINGFLIDTDAEIAQTADRLRRLSVHGKTGQQNGILYAVGDGNHSLAAAKMVWEELKKKTAVSDHPMRYAMVELVNLHDPGLVFEPIHRVLFNVEKSHFINELCLYYYKQRINVSVKELTSKETLLKERAALYTENRSFISFASGSGYGIIELENPENEIEIALFQPFFDRYVASQHHAGMDYVHGGETLIRLGSEEKNIGLLMNPIKKEALFITILNKGHLPRKTFSMGEADEKRFYMECRKIGG